MITVSGNLATNVVLDEVGTDEVAALLADAGCSARTTIVRGIEDYHARDAGFDNLITADDMARLMVALAEGRLAGPDATVACERSLRAQEYRNGIPAGLPDGLDIGNKTGWITGVNHDVARYARRACLRSGSPCWCRAGQRGRARGRDRADRPAAWAG
jgi:beta-lactamase class A